MSGFWNAIFRIADPTTPSRQANVQQTGAVNSLSVVNYDANGSVIDPSVLGKTLKTASGSVSSSGNNTIISGVASKRLKVYSFALTYINTTANLGYFRDGTSGAELRRYNLQSPSNVTVGANDSVDPNKEGNFLFATTAGNALVINLSTANAMSYSVSYWDDDAT